MRPLAACIVILNPGNRDSSRDALIGRDCNDDEGYLGVLVTFDLAYYCFSGLVESIAVLPGMLCLFFVVKSCILMEKLPDRG
jgi:hypothetical protein